MKTNCVMTLYYNNCCQNNKNADYPIKAEVQCSDDLTKVVAHDHVGAEYKGNRRKKENFIRSNCTMLDIDNSETDVPEEWICPEDVRKAFPNVPFYISFSRNHLKQKNGKTPRPKFHVYFPDINFENGDDYRAHKEKVCSYFPAFDQNAKDAARFFFGVEKPQVEYYDGDVLLFEFMKNIITSESSSKSECSSPECSSKTADMGEKKAAKRSSTLRNDGVIPEGCRNSTLISYAASVLKKYGDESKSAYTLYIKRSKCCSPLLDDDEVQRIWESALKFYKNTIKKSCDYIDPEQFNGSSNTTESYHLDVKNEEGIKSLRIQRKQDEFIYGDVVKAFLCAYGIKVRYNEMTHGIEISGLPEVYRGEKELETLATIATDMLSSFKFNVRSRIYNILDVIALENRYHPALDRINSAEWDGEDRLPEIYAILGISDDFSKSLIRKWAIQSIAIMHNKESNPISSQGILVLQGAQGIGKTEFFKHLAIEESFFKEGAVLDLKNKDTIISATSVWLCELGELDSTTGKKQPALKSFLTASTDRYREPYAKQDVIRVRRTAFCGTVNPVSFLSDETGNRRYWTIHVEKIDHKKLFGYPPEWYAQFWRQILCEYVKNPKAYLLSPEENELLNKRNEDYEENLYGEDEFLATFDITAPVNKWSYRTVSEIVEILNEKYKKLNLSSSAFGKTLIPKLERRFNVEFKKKTVSGKRLKLCPPMFPKISSDRNFEESYRVDISQFARNEDSSTNQEDDDVEF